MNLVLFEPSEIDRPLPRSDRRAIHLLRVLRRRAGDTFDAGVVDGPRGQGTLVAEGPENLTLAFRWGDPPAPLDPLILIVGLPRPQTARDILREATALGVTAMHFVATERGEPGYARSPLWTAGEWRRQLLAGAEQAFDTRLPEVTTGQSLAATLGGLSAPTIRLALDNYEATGALADCAPPPVESAASGPPPPVALAVGSERGWTESERSTLRGAGFVLAHLGPRVLRTETAIIAALAVVKFQRR